MNLQQSHETIFVGIKIIFNHTFFCLWHQVAFILSIHITMSVHWYNQLHFLHTFIIYHYYQFIHCLDVIIEPLLYIFVEHIAFQLMYIHLTIERHSIFRVPTAGFKPPKQREDCYQSTTLPPSHHGWITHLKLYFFLF